MAENGAATNRKAQPSLNVAEIQKLASQLIDPNAPATSTRP